MVSLSTYPNATLLKPLLCSLAFPSSSTSSSRSSFSLLASTTRVKMSSPSLPPLPENRIVLGCGTVVVDFLAAVAAYPKPDDKIRSTSLKVQGGGNAGNTLTCAARLGLNPRLISKVADDTQGRGILEELKADGVDTSFLVVSEEGNSPFTYVIVDNQTKTRTCIHSPGFPPMIPDDLSQSSLLSALDGARLVYFDGRLHETALVVAQEATRKSIPILIDAERKREGLDDLLNLANYVVCSAKFPQAWTEAPSVPSALVSMLLRLPNIKFVIVTLGEDGCIMIERSVNVQSEEMDVDSLLESLKQRKDDDTAIPTCVSSIRLKFKGKTTLAEKRTHAMCHLMTTGTTYLCHVSFNDDMHGQACLCVKHRSLKIIILSWSWTKLRANGIGTVSGRLFVGTAEKIPPSELIDTTGAGDAFIGAVLYAICADMPPEKMLPFAAQVAAAGCRALGARTGLPHRTDPHLASFLH